MATVGIKIDNGHALIENQIKLGWICKLKYNRPHKTDTMKKERERTNLDRFFNAKMANKIVPAKRLSTAIPQALLVFIMLAKKVPRVS